MKKRAVKKLVITRQTLNNLQLAGIAAGVHTTGQTVTCSQSFLIACCRH